MEKSYKMQQNTIITMSGSFWNCHFDITFVIYVTYYEFKLFPLLHDVGSFLNVKNQTALSSCDTVHPTLESND